MNVHEELMTAIASDTVEEAMLVIKSGIDLNSRCDQGAPALYGAILLGNITIVREMLNHSADPNLIADEPAASIYTEKPLDLARQCRFLMDWDKYDPIVRLLEQFGAKVSDGLVNSIDTAEIEKRARTWQTCQ